MIEANEWCGVKHPVRSTKLSDVDVISGVGSSVDEFQWLEDIYGAESLRWVDQQNARTLAALDTEQFATLQQRILEVLDSTDRIPYVTMKGEWLYNHWRDAEHPRGLWRRTSLDQYREDEPEWDVLLDIDAVGQAEGTEWVFVGASLLYPTWDRALILLSPDGGDAFVVREFDLATRTFVVDGFVTPVAKTNVAWIDRDTVLIGTDFGEGTMTVSSYPRQVRRWRRGTPLLDAALIQEIPDSHMGVWADYDHTPGYERIVLEDRIDFYTANHLVEWNGEIRRLDLPADSEASLHRDWLAIWPRSDWHVGETVHPAGSLLIASLERFMAGDIDLEEVFLPDERTSLVTFSWTRNALLLTTLRDVVSRVDVLEPGEDGWTRRPIGLAEPNQTVRASAADPDAGDAFWLIDVGFVQPETLRFGTVESAGLEVLKSAPSFFDGSRFEVEQHFATSDDGTRVPYFQVSLREMVRDGSMPALLYGYGGFEIPITPAYSGAVGRSWLEEGGVYVVANIRGGGEYGPTWHQAALRENRLRAYEDFAAVARDLVSRRVTSPARLGCIGGSNGGLLVGNMLTRYPELFGAVVCEVPLLDMQRYTKLSAGASWIAEYGDPDVADDWQFIRTFSPYHNLQAEITYPPVLFYTATSDDRVGPVQARKMAARMLDLRIPNVLFYENREGGHGGAADNSQRAHMDAMAYAFALAHLKDDAS